MAISGETQRRWLRDCCCPASGGRLAFAGHGSGTVFIRHNRFVRFNHSDETVRPGCIGRRRGNGLRRRHRQRPPLDGGNIASGQWICQTRTNKVRPFTYGADSLACRFLKAAFARRNKVQARRLSRGSRPVFAYSRPLVTIKSFLGRGHSEVEGRLHRLPMAHPKRLKLKIIGTSRVLKTFPAN